MSKQIIFDSPHPALPVPDMSVTEWVIQGLRKSHDTPVFTETFSGISITGQHAIDQIQALAGALVAQGLQKGDVVAVMAPNSIHYFVLFQATALAGGTLTMINPRYTAAELDFQLRATNAAMLFYDPGLTEMAQTALSATDLRNVVAMDTTALDAFIDTSGAAPLTTQVPIDPDQDVAVIPYSSGTTGLPKGVMLTHRNLLANATQWQDNRNIGPQDVAPVFLPFFHIFGLMLCQIVFPGSGGHLHLMQRFNLEEYLQIAQDTKAKRLNVVPPIAVMLAKDPRVDRYDLSAVTDIGSGAAPLSSEIGQLISERLDCQFYQGYGMTELSGSSHSHPTNSTKWETLGVTVANGQSRIVDPDTKEDCDVGVAGELWVRGPFVMKGYLNNPEATAEVLTEDGWLRTGDICSFDAEGHLSIHDRLKEMIKSNGFPVAPAEVEAALITHTSIKDAAVFGAPDPEKGEVPMAVLVFEAGEVLGLEEIQTYLSTKLATYKIVQRIEVVQDIPKAPSGKILRRVLRQQFLNTN
ncbi:AMP-binding protein [Ascidiaceihabitans sp.]|uniref:AMP-binding protein n=1 Tax=Ascidiaceihabitans sp. TaxID=1872644 RepID=UPI0032986C14